MAWSDAARAAAAEARRLKGTHPKFEGAKNALVKAINRTGASRAEVMKNYRKNLAFHRKMFPKTPLFKAKLTAVRMTTQDIQTFGARDARMAKGLGNPKWNSK